MTMRWLLDTCVVSELARDLPDARVRDWLTRHAADSALSAVSLGELKYGIERKAAGRMRNGLQLWFERLCTQYAARTLATDEPVWMTFGRLKASVEAIGRPQEDFDLLIASTAAVHRLTLVTRNTKHFADTGVPLVDPWI